MKLFRISGGVHPHDRKGLTASLAIEDVPLPPLLHIPLQQHIGSPAAPLVHRGQLVRKGELLAHSQGLISAPVHAPTSGRIVGIGNYPAHHPSGLSVRTVTLKPDGEERWCDLDTVTAFEFGAQGNQFVVDLCRYAAIADIGMHRVGKVDTGRAVRH